VGKKVVIKFKASEDVGLGHLYRSISLSEILRSVGYQVVCAINDFTLAKRELSAKSVRWLVNAFDSEEAFVDYLLAVEKPEVIVFDEKYEYRRSDLLRWKSRARLVSIDFVGADYHLFDRILIPNAHFINVYPALRNVLWGFEYVIINESVRKKIPRDEPPTGVNNIVVTTGGSDPEGVFFWLLDVFKGIHKNATFLVGKAFKHRKDLCLANVPRNVAVRPYSLDVLLEADVVVSLFGVTVYELIYLRIPTIVVAHTKENAVSACVLKERCGCVETLGFFRDIGIEVAREGIRDFIKDKSKLAEIFNRERLLKIGDATKIAAAVVGGEERST